MRDVFFSKSVSLQDMPEYGSKSVCSLLVSFFFEEFIVFGQVREIPFTNIFNRNVALTMNHIHPCVTAFYMFRMSRLAAKYHFNTGHGLF